MIRLKKLLAVKAMEELRMRDCFNEYNNSKAWRNR